MPRYSAQFALLAEHFEVSWVYIMASIEFSAEHKTLLVSQIQKYFERELDQDIGDFDAEFLLDFFTEKVGGFYYNEGLNDAKALLDDKLDTITESFSELEKVTEFSR